MKIATWNIERLKHKKELSAIEEACFNLQADILVLTESDFQVDLDFPFCYHTPPLAEILPDYYKATEHRVTIFSKFPCVMEHDTYDKYTALCVELETPQGNLLVYGTIMGIFGNREKSFRPDLKKQLEDFHRLSASGLPLCICGDYNLSFADNYYFTNWGRKTVLDSFAQNKIRLLTADVSECIDHIAVTDSFVSGRTWNVQEWNLDKRLSDHKGIVVEI